MTHDEKIEKAHKLINELNKLELPKSEIHKLIGETETGIEMEMDSALLEQDLVDEAGPTISKGGF